MLAAAPGRRDLAWFAAGVLMLLAGLELISVVGSLRATGEERAGERAEQQAIGARAEAFAIAYASYHHRDDGGYLPSLRRHASAALREWLDQAEVRVGGPVQERTSEAVVRAVTVQMPEAPGAGAAAETGEVTEARARVRLEVVRTWWETAGETRVFVQQEVEQELQMELVKESGRWLVASCEPVSERPLGAERRS